MIKNNFRILKKTHAYLQTILKTPVKFQKDRTKTVGGVKGTKYLLKLRNHAPHPTESQKQCPSSFLRKGGGQKKKHSVSVQLRVEKYITKTCLYNNDPLKLHFYIVKLGFTGVYIIFLFLLKNIICGYSVELPH